MHGRSLKITGFGSFPAAQCTVPVSKLIVPLPAGDPYTRNKLSKGMETTVAIIKPDAYDHVGKIMHQITSSGLKVTRMQMLRLSDSEASEFYRSCVNDVDAAGARSAHLAGNSIVALELMGNDSIGRWNDLAQDLRQNYAASSIEDAVHAAASAEEARRQTDFFFGRKFKSIATYDNCTCCVIRPHAVREGNAGQILDMILAQGYEISAMKMYKLTKVESSEFLEVYQSVVPWFEQAVDELCSGQCIALELRASDAVLTFRQTAGPWDVDMARQLRPNTIRAKFGATNINSGVHCTDLPDDGSSECQYFFDILG